MFLNNLCRMMLTLKRSGRIVVEGMVMFLLIVVMTVKVPISEVVTEIVLTEIELTTIELTETELREIELSVNVKTLLCSRCTLPMLPW